MEPDEQPDEQSGFRLPVNKDVALVGLLALAVVVAFGFAAENERLRATLNGPAMGKIKPCDCDDASDQPKFETPTIYEGPVTPNGYTGLREASTSDSGADASGGGTA